MTKRYLMRLGKTPFEVADPFSTFDRNLLGTNSGNLVYGAAAHKLFSTHDTIVDANHYRINAKMADVVNDEYDGFILPLANAFRPEFEGQLLRTAEFLERLKIPFMMLSGGAQLPLDGDPSALKAIEPTVKRFARAVLNGSSALSVRGEMSADYLRSLGFRDVVVVGCPSLALHGPGHRVEVPSSLEFGSSIVYNLETRDPFGADLIADAEENYDSAYIAQEHGTLELMLWATDPYVGSDPRLPLEKSHPQFTSARAEMYIDAYPWIERMGRAAFSFGARAHGNIAAVLAGTPSVMLAHDSRTVELAQYHQIPYLVRGGEGTPSTVREIFERADFTEFNRGHAARFEVLSDFIHENGFQHIYDRGQERALESYERTISALKFPPAVRPTWLGANSTTTQRHAVLQERERARKTSHSAVRKDVAKNRKRSDEQSSELSRRLGVTEERLAEAMRRAEVAEGQVAATQDRLAKLEKRLTKLARTAEEAADRSQRAVRVPTRLRTFVSRGKQDD